MVAAVGDYMKVKVHACVGGTAVREDLGILRDGVHVVVGTPGRVYDMIQRGALKLNKLKLFVMDEADQMLDRGFKDQIYEIFSSGLPKDTQVALFSATMPQEALELTSKFMNDPATILVKRDELTLDGACGRAGREGGGGGLVFVDGDCGVCGGGLMSAAAPLYGNDGAS